MAGQRGPSMTRDKQERRGRGLEIYLGNTARSASGQILESVGHLGRGLASSDDGVHKDV